MSVLRAFGPKKTREILEQTERASEGSGAPLQGEVSLRALLAASGATPRTDLTRRLDLAMRGPAPIPQGPSFGPGGGGAMAQQRGGGYQQQRQQQTEILVSDGTKTIH